MAEFGTGRAVTDEVESSATKPPVSLRVLQAIAIIGSFAFAGYTAYGLHAEYDTHMAAMAEAKVMAGDYEAEQVQYASRKPATAEAISEYVSAARTAGEGLAKAQTGYFGYTGSTDGSVSTYAEETVGKFFTENGQVDRVPWMPGMREAYEWHFAEPVSVSKDGVPCVWFCTIGDDIVGYAHGTYSTKSGLFENVDWYLTAKGKEYELYQGYKTTEDGFELSEDKENTSETIPEASSSEDADGVNRGPAAEAGYDPVLEATNGQAGV